MKDNMGGNSGSREPDPQAVPALSGFDPGRLRALSERCEQLRFTWADITLLNEAIHAITADPKTVIPPDYCRSLDAAMDLIPGGWKLHFLQDTEYDNPVEKTWSAALRPREENPVGNEEQSWCATPSLAICAAALRAIAMEAAKPVRP